MKTATVVEKGSIKFPIETVEEQLPTLFEILNEFDGIADDLPSDLAANLDR